MELKQLPRESTLALITEMEDNSIAFNTESNQISGELGELGEKKRLLQVAMNKTESGMAQTIMQNMIDEVEELEENQKVRMRHCQNNSKYYSDIAESLKEALKEF